MTNALIEQSTNRQTAGDAAGLTDVAQIEADISRQLQMAIIAGESGLVDAQETRNLLILAGRSFAWYESRVQVLKSRRIAAADLRRADGMNGKIAELQRLQEQAKAAAVEAESRVRKAQEEFHAARAASQSAAADVAIAVNEQRRVRDDAKRQLAESADPDIAAQSALLRSERATIEKNESRWQHAIRECEPIAREAAVHRRRFEAWKNGEGMWLPTDCNGAFKLPSWLGGDGLSLGQHGIPEVTPAAIERAETWLARFESQDYRPRLQAAIEKGQARIVAIDRELAELAAKRLDPLAMDFAGDSNQADVSGKTLRPNGFRNSSGVRSSVRPDRRLSGPTGVVVE